MLGSGAGRAQTSIGRVALRETRIDIGRLAENDFRLIELQA